MNEGFLDTKILFNTPSDIVKWKFAGLFYNEIEKIIMRGWKMAIISEEIVINVPVNIAFDFVAETPKLVEVWPSLTAIRDWERDENGLGEFKFEYQIIGFKYKGTNRDIEFERNKKIVTKSTEGMDALLTWEFVEHPAGVLVRFTGDYNVEIPLIGKVVSERVAMLNGLEVGALLRNLKSKLEMEQVKQSRLAERKAF